jgi:hypothetical protein
MCGGKRVPIEKQWDEMFMCIMGSTILGGEHELFSPPTSIVLLTCLGQPFNKALGKHIIH